MIIFLGIMIPFIGTSFGSMLVFFVKNKINKNIEKIIIGFSIGIMLASSIFSLLIPSIELSKDDNIIFLIPSLGLFIGFLSLYIINKISSNSNMLACSVTIHNIPEGMAVGVSFAGVIASNYPVSGALMLSLAIALQNIPEGLIISLPCKIKGNSKIKSFILGVLSGIVEPIASLLTIIFINISPMLPFLLSYAAGCMIYVIFDELILEIHNDNKPFLGLLGIFIGFIIMMILDISF